MLNLSKPMGLSMLKNELSEEIISGHVGLSSQALRDGGQLLILPNLGNKALLAHTLFDRWLPELSSAV